MSLGSKIQAFLDDPKKRPYILGGGAVAGLLVILWLRNRASAQAAADASQQANDNTNALPFYPFGQMGQDQGTSDFPGGTQGSSGSTPGDTPVPPAQPVPPPTQPVPPIGPAPPAQPLPPVLPGARSYGIGEGVGGARHRRPRTGNGPSGPFGRAEAFIDTTGGALGDALDFTPYPMGDSGWHAFDFARDPISPHHIAFPGDPDDKVSAGMTGGSYFIGGLGG